MTTRYVFDTNIISFYLRNDKAITSKLAVLALTDHEILGCPVVWYEVRRGLLYRDAKSQIKRFETTFATFIWDHLTLADWELAADLWVQRRNAGRPIEDADLMIAVFAINRDGILVTDNEKDFDGLPVRIENWKT
jgi:tRNA(fMet)-specific endonuclease VapC